MTEQKKRNNTGLWKRKSKNGNVYLGGSLDKYWVSYFNNSRADKDVGDPDGFLKLYPKKDSGAEEITVNMYQRVSKAGKKYIAGARGHRFNIFANEKKHQQSPKAPDYNLSIYPLDDKKKVQVTEEGTRQPEMPLNQGVPEEPSARLEDLPGLIKSEEPEEQMESTEVDSDDIPF